MPTFTSKLPVLSKNHGFDLRRTSASKPLTAICTSDEFLCCDTHFWRGRTMPCERTTNDEGRTLDDSNCPACLAKQPWRTHVYLSAFEVKTSLHFIFECTAFAAKPFQEYLDSVGTLRGCGFQASRPRGGPNSKVVILCATANLNRCPIPAPPDIAASLAVIWRLPRTALSEVSPPYDPTKIVTDPNLLARVRNQLDNAGDPESIGDVIAGNGHSRKQKVK